MQLDCETPIDFTLDDLEVRDPDPDKLMPFLAKMEFRTLTRRIADKLGVEPLAIPEPEVKDAPEGDAPDAPEIDPEKYEWVKDMEALDRWIALIRDYGYVAVDTETTSLNEMQAEFAGICLAVVPGTRAISRWVTKWATARGSLPTTSWRRDNCPSTTSSRH